MCTNLECSYFHVKGTKRYKSTDVHNVKEKPAQKVTSKSTDTESMKSGKNPGTEKQTQNTFLEKSPTVKESPTIQLESGTGYGEAMKTMMTTLNQILLIQNQQSQHIHLLTQSNPLALQTQRQAVQNLCPILPYQTLQIQNPML